MNKNFIFLTELLNEHKSLEINRSLLKEFLFNYFNRDYSSDYSFLKFIDFFKIYLNKIFFNYKFDYKKYVNFNIPDKSQVIVFLNGHLFCFDNLSEGIFFNIFSSLEVEMLSDLLFFNDNHIFDNLNFFSVLNILFYRSLNSIRITDKMSGLNSLYILNFFDSNFPEGAFFPRFFFKIDKNVCVNILEYYINLSKAFVNSNTHIFLDYGSKVVYNFINESNALGTHSFYSKAYSSNLSFTSYSFGYNSFKSNCYFFLFDKLCKLYIKTGGFFDNQTINSSVFKIFHLGGESFSRIENRCVLKGSVNCEFHGLIDVSSDVSGIDAGLNCKGLVLSEHSQLKLLPELSIKSSDIKCFHGAAVGFVDFNVIFYIMSRGFSNDECMSLLVKAFLFDLICVDSFFINDFIYILFKKYYMC